MKCKFQRFVAFFLVLIAIATFIPAVYATDADSTPQADASSSDQQELESDTSTEPTESPEESQHQTSSEAQMFAAAPGGKTITITAKNGFFIGYTEFNYHQYISGAYYPVGPYFTETAAYFSTATGGYAFCVQPSKQGVIGDHVEGEWSKYIDTEAMIGIGRALCYGAPNNGDTSEEGLQATTLLIWDIATAYRGADGTKRTYDANGDRMSPPFYKVAYGAVKTKYDDILDKMQNHSKIPSFAAPAEGLITDAHTILLNFNSATGLYEASVTDTNEILADYNYTSDISGLTFTRDGNTLKISATEAAATQIGAGQNFFARGHYYEVTDKTALVWSNAANENSQQVTTLPAKIDPVPAYIRIALPTGSISITKTTEDGKNLSGWQFSIYEDEACTKLLYGPYSSGSDRKINIPDLTAGNVWVKEIGHVDAAVNALYKCDSTNPQKVTIVPGQTAKVSFYNRLNVGQVKLIKTTNTGSDLSGWKIGLYYDATCTNHVSGSPFTTGADGSVTVPNLNLGTLYAKEEPVSDPYWKCDTEVKTVTVVSNQTATVSFYNTHYGDLRIKKNAVNGSAEGWSFQIYSGNTLVETIKTGSDSYAHSGKLLPGNYKIVEVQDRDSTYWTYDATIEKTVTVTAGSQAQVEYTNTQYGRLEFHKTTNTGNHLDGWVFRVTDSNGNHIGDYTTDSTGYAVTGKIAPSRYTVQELSTNNAYWVCDVEARTIDVTAGKTATASWLNKERGRGVFRKTTNTGENLEGWNITVYTDPACTKELVTLTTGADGRNSHYFEPGIYYAKETGDIHGRFDTEFWAYDSTAKEFEITASAKTEVLFSNTHYGKLKIVKAMDTEGPLEGWVFKVTDSNGQEIPGSPFTSQSDGSICTDLLLPGQYTVEELLPENSIYSCLSVNPQTVSVNPGETAEVVFINTVRPGSISVKKTDTFGNPLTGAKFLLEWSISGTTWEPVEYSADGPVSKGACTAAGLDKGMLTIPENGVATFTGLHPELYYRLSEIAAPDGKQLSAAPVFEGRIPIDEALSVSVTVVNGDSYVLPLTGSTDMLCLLACWLLSMTVGTCSFVTLRRKER